MATTTPDVSGASLIDWDAGSVVYPTDSTPSPSFVNNGIYEVISGAKYVDSHGLPTRFSVPTFSIPDPGYRTKVGMCFYSGAHIYANSAPLAQALQRNMAERENPPDWKGPPRSYELQMTWNQSNYFAHYGDYLRGCREKFAPDDEWLIEPLDYIIAHIRDPHPKRDLRVHALEQLLELSPGVIWSLALPELKLKLLEWAKKNKLGRTIGDIGVHASLVGCYYMAMVKHHMEAHPLRCFGGEIHFLASPSTSTLDELFTRLWDIESPPLMYVHSDDSVYGITVVDSDGHRRRRVFDIDISKCDRSHKDGLFSDFLDTWEDAHGTVAKLYRQCFTDVVVNNPCKEFKERVVYRMREKMLLSGSTLTTAANTHANSAGGSSLIRSRAHDVQTIVAAGREVGYEYDVVERFRPSESTFLKNNPVDVDGRFHSILNFGVYVRTAGFCMRDLPGKRSQFRQNASDYQALLLNGMYSKVDCPFLQMLRRKWPMPGTSRRKLERLIHVRESKGNDVITLTDREFFQRYDATDAEIAELTELCHMSTPDQAVYCSLADRALRVDYGLGFGLQF